VTVKTTTVAPRVGRDVPATFAHLARLTDDTGLFEHARHATARREHGYCTDDVARGLVVTSRETAPSAEVLRLAELPSSGWQSGGPRLRHDQQPIEVAALADACATAAAITGDAIWHTGVRQSIDWFLGANDIGEVMWDPATGGGYDGLTLHGPNLNQGAESTLALISTLQHRTTR
jgi:hypothetical protein